MERARLAALNLGVIRHQVLTYFFFTLFFSEYLLFSVLNPFWFFSLLGSLLDPCFSILLNHHLFILFCLVTLSFPIIHSFICSLFAFSSNSFIHLPPASLSQIDANQLQTESSKTTQPQKSHRFKCMYLSVEAHIHSFFLKKPKFCREKGTRSLWSREELQQAVQWKPSQHYAWINISEGQWLLKKQETAQT